MARVAKGKGIEAPGARVVGDFSQELLQSSVARALFGVALDQPMIGRYELRRVLGRGAMGIVYEAWDRHLARVVALKVLTSVVGDAAAQALHEAKALAKLNHGNVVTLYDGERIGGLFVISMEYTAATRLESHAAANALRFWQRLGLCLDAGRGVAAVHQQGLVHRDIKPSNILVGETGQVKLGDFGVACDAAQATHHRAGTAGFMAPEVVAGAPATFASDQYSLAKTCQALLVPAALEPGRWSPWRRKIGSILRRAAAAAPSDRYHSVHEFLVAIERVMARRQWMIRGGAVVVALAIAGAIGAVTAGKKEARTARMAQINACEASVADFAATWRGLRAELPKAPSDQAVAYDETVTRIDDHVRQFAAVLHDEVLGACAGEAEPRSPSNASGKSAKLACLRRLARAGEHTLREVVRTLPSELPVALEATYQALDVTPCVDETAIDATSIAATGAMLRAAPATALLEAAALADSMERPRDANAMVSLAEHLSPVGTSNALSATLALGQATLDLNQYPAAIDAYGRAIALAEQVGADAAAAQGWLGQVAGFTSQGDLAAAHVAATQAAAKIARLGGPIALSAQLVLAKASLAFEEGAYADTEALLTPLLLTLARQDVMQAAYMRGLLMLTKALDLQGKYADAARTSAQALAFAERTYGTAHRAYASALVRDAVVAYRRGDVAASTATLRRSEAIYAKVYGSPSVQLALVQRELATDAFTAGDVAVARDLIGRAIAMRTEVLGARHLSLAIDLSNAARMWLGVDPARAERYLITAMSIVRERLGDGHPRVVSLLQRLGQLRMSQRKTKAALKAYAAAWERCQAPYGSEDALDASVVAGVAHSYGNALVHAGRVRDAIPLLRRAVDTPDRLPFDASLSKFLLAYALDEVGEHHEALGLAAAARAAWVAMGTARADDMVREVDAMFPPGAEATVDGAR